MIHKNLNFTIEKRGEDYILLLHGWGGNKDSLRCMDLHTEHSVISLDFFSSKENFSSDYDTYQSAVDVYLCLMECGIKKVSIIAHSYGGRVAIILSSLFDIEVTNLVLISSAGLVTFDPIVLLKKLNYKIIKLLTKLKVYTPKIFDKYGSSDYKNLDSNFKFIFNNIIRQDLRYLLKDIDAKNTLILYGDRDTITPIRYMKILRKYISNSKTFVVKHGDHFMYLYQNKYIIDIIANNMI